MFRNFPNNIVDSFYQVAVDYLIPAQQFIFSWISSFLNLIESKWYYIFPWFLANSVFIIFVVGKSIFDWVDLFRDGVLEWGLASSRKQRLEAEYNDKYEERKKQNRAEAEQRYYMRQAEYEKKAKVREEQRQISKANREKEKNALTHYVGSNSQYSDDYLARAYFEANPNRLVFNYGGKKFINQSLLNKYAENKNRNEHDLLFGKDTPYDSSVNYLQVFNDSNTDEDDDDE